MAQALAIRARMMVVLVQDVALQLDVTPMGPVRMRVAAALRVVVSVHAASGVQVRLIVLVGMERRPRTVVLDLGFG
ncbi:hypothetical protein BN2476_2130017 [Paraburkholderia piptadeniae]|uniref:Uncharacterized protein n=1 Tax=Paraburkholderia piptadeniae TaxID=1701573 RepID=A0A1N7SXR9_9BURK|nr:hypothetical protein BN2476_2130017 [Paraburkholderia piptadeniae]